MDRFLPEVSEEPSAKAMHINALEFILTPIGYSDALARRHDALRALDAVAFDVRIAGKLVAGLGLRGVLEAGLALEHTWGTPVIPGSSLKGAAGAACAEIETPGWNPPNRTPNGEDRAAGEHYRALFGTAKDGIGAVTFHDAWWVPADRDRTLPLRGDVMTPHAPGYYRGPGDVPPPKNSVTEAEHRAERARYEPATSTQSNVNAKPLWIRRPDGTEDPIPVPFAIVASARFRIWLTGDTEWCGAAKVILLHALSHRGVGAKTDSGYGRLVEIEKVV
jgi:CRISPR-associated protein Cmr6